MFHKVRITVSVCVCVFHDCEHGVGVKNKDLTFGAITHLWATKGWRNQIVHSKVNDDLSISLSMFTGNILQCLSCASMNHYPDKSTLALIDNYIY